MLNILFTCAGRRNYLLKYFKEILKDDGFVIASDSQITAPAMVVADIAIEVPSIFHPQYLQSLIDIVRDYHVSAIIPLNDLELPFLARNKRE